MDVGKFESEVGRMISFSGLLGSNAYMFMEGVGGYSDMKLWMFIIRMEVDGD